MVYIMLAIYPGLLWTKKEKNGYQARLQHMTILLLPSKANIDPHDAVTTDTVEYI